MSLISVIGATTCTAKLIFRIKWIDPSITVAPHAKVSPFWLILLTLAEVNIIQSEFKYGFEDDHIKVYQGWKVLHLNASHTAILSLLETRFWVYSMMKWLSVATQVKAIKYYIPGTLFIMLPYNTVRDCESGDEILMFDHSN